MSENLPRRTLMAWMASGLAGLGPAVAFGASAPISAVTLIATDGLPVLADAPLARLTYIDFWASWCTPCRLSFPWMNAMHDRYAPEGLRIVAVGLDRDTQAAQHFLRQIPARFATAFDPQARIAQAVGVQSMPQSFLIGRDRRSIWTHRGFRLEDRRGLELQLQEALA